MLNFIRASCAILFFAALTACGGGSVSLTPEPFTRERADGKIPVKAELIREQVRRELSGMPEGESEVRRWQAIEADYHSCRLSSKKAAGAAEEVFAECMANRGYVYMYRLDAEQLHNDIEFEMEKDPDKWLAQVVTATIAASPKLVTATVAASPITITNTLPQVISTISETEADGGDYTKYLLGVAAVGGIAAAVAGGGGDDSGSGNPNVSTPPAIVTTRMTMGIFVTIRNESLSRCRQEYIQMEGCARYDVIRQNSVVFVSSPIAVISTRIAGCTGRDRYGLDHFYPILCRAGAFVITTFVPLVPVITTTRITTFATMIDGKISYSPQMRQVVYAAMADGFNRGVAIGDSGFALSGRYDGEDRAAGFTYDFGDFGNFALRTDYIRLPAKQDSAVWLDAYRFGALTRVNDEVQFFAGVDSYRNAIIAIDAKGDRMHRLGFAIGDGYAVKYEYRLNL